MTRARVLWDGTGVFERTRVAERGRVHPQALDAAALR